MGFDFEMGIDCSGGSQFELWVKRETDREEEREIAMDEEGDGEKDR